MRIVQTRLRRMESVTTESQLNTKARERVTEGEREQSYIWQRDFRNDCLPALNAITENNDGEKNEMKTAFLEGQMKLLRAWETDLGTCFC